MRKSIWTLSLMGLLAMGCSGPGSTTGISGTGGSSGNTTSQGGFAIQELPVVDGGTLFDTMAAARRSDGHIGIAYYSDVDVKHKRLDYLEVDANGQTVQAVNLAPSVENVTDPAVAFDQNGDALVAYLGNDPNSNDESDMLTDGGEYWEESDLALATINPAGQVNTQYLVDLSNQAFFDPTGSGNSPENFGWVVGLSPAIQIMPDGQALIVYRDVHDGTSGDLQGFTSSDVEAVLGTPGAAAASWQHIMVMPGRDNTDLSDRGLGAGSTIALSGGTAVLVCSGQPASKYTGLYSSTFTLDAGWLPPTGRELYPNFPRDVTSNLGNGEAPTGNPHVVANPDGGFAMVWDDEGTQTVEYATSKDAVNWSSPSDVFVGSGGWFPNLAFDTSFSPPLAAVVYYFCSDERGGQYGQCPATEQELRLSEQRPDGSWSELQIDPAGGAYPYLFFDQNNMPVLVYRSLASGGIRMAVEEGP